MSQVEFSFKDVDYKAKKIHKSYTHTDAHRKTLNPIGENLNKCRPLITVKPEVRENVYSILYL